MRKKAFPQPASPNYPNGAGGQPQDCGMTLEDFCAVMSLMGRRAAGDTRPSHIVAEDANADAEALMQVQGYQ